MSANYPGVKVDYAAEAARLLKNAARHITEEPGDMRIAEVSALVGSGFASLAHLPEVQAETGAQLEAVLGVVVDHVMRMSTSWEAEARVHAAALMRDLDGVGVNIDRRVEERSELDGKGPRLCDVLGHRYDLTRQWIDRHGKCWEHTGDWSDVGGPVMRRDEPLGDSMVLVELVREYGPLSQAVRAPVAPSRPVECPF